MKNLFKIFALLTVVATPMGVGFYFYTRGVFDQISTPLSIAQVIPNDSAMTLFISPKPQAIHQLQKFIPPETEKLINQNLQEFQDKILTSKSLDFKSDLKPWIGGIGWAFIPSENSDNSDKNNSMKILWVVPIKNKLAAWQLMNQLKKQGKNQGQEIQSQGQTFWKIQEDGGRFYHLTMIDEKVLISDSLDILKKAIKTSQQQTSLGQQKPEIFKDMDVEKSLVTLYINDYPQTIKSFTESLPNSTDIPVETLKNLQKVQSLRMVLTVDQLGIKIKGITQFSEQFNPIQIPPNSGKILEKFPSDSLMLMSYSNLDQIWLQLNSQAEKEPELMIGIEQITSIFKSVDLDINQDIFGWMNGEFAVGTIASNQGMLSQIGMGVGIIIETNDRKTATKTLTKLDNLAQKSLVNIDQKNRQGITITEWKLPQQTETLLGHGWLNDRLLLIAIGEPMIDIFTQPSPMNFTQNSNFKLIRQSLTQPNQGYFYFDMEKMNDWLNNYVLNTSNNRISPEIATLMNYLKAIGMTTTWLDSKTVQIEMLWLLKSSSLSPTF